MRREETLAAHGASVERVVQELRRTSDRILTLEEMAEIACVSPFHFNRIFHRSTGVSPRRFQCSLRIEYAKRLLVTTDLAPLEVCLECGYSSLGTFTRRFGDMVGWPPQRFREMSRHVGPFGELLATRADQVSEAATSFGRVDAQLGRFGVTGIIRAPASFHGWIFIAAFENPVPQGVPVACTIASGPGRFKLGPVRNGVCHVMAAGIEQACSDTCLLLDRALRAASAPLVIQDGVLIEAEPELHLRESHNLDVPILLPLGLVLSQKIRSSHPMRPRAQSRPMEAMRRSRSSGMLSQRLSPTKSCCIDQETKKRAAWLNTSGRKCSSPLTRSHSGT
jgi:AraC family transcriptional regulator